MLSWKDENMHPARARMMWGEAGVRRERLGAIRKRASEQGMASLSPQFLHARACYGHLAGELAVKLLEAMLKARWLAAEGNDYRLTRLGETTLAGLGIDVAAARKARRSFARGCVDLTQRRPHLGGALGDALLAGCVARRWAKRRRGSRVISITAKGNESFRRLFGVN
jgi:hypothetical protein